MPLSPPITVQLDILKYLDCPCICPKLCKPIPLQLIISKPKAALVFIATTSTLRLPLNILSSILILWA